MTEPDVKGPPDAPTPVRGAAILIGIAAVVLVAGVAFAIRGARHEFWNDLVTFSILALLMLAVIVDTLRRWGRARRAQRAQWWRDHNRRL